MSKSENGKKASLPSGRKRISTKEGVNALARVQKLTGALFIASAFFGIYLLATDQSLWLLAVSHAYGLALIIAADVVLGILSLLSVRRVYLPSIVWAILTIFLQIGDIVTAPQYKMTVGYFASYLFGLWAYDAFLVAQVVAVVSGLLGRQYLQFRIKKKVTYFDMASKNSRRDFLQIVGSIAILVGLAGIFGVAEALGSNLTQNTTTNSTGTTNPLPSGAIANFSQLLELSPVYFDYPAGYPNALFKKPDGTVAALSMLCTHVCCECTFESGSGRIFCPCHGSVFDDSGNVLGGPAPLPLPSVELSIDQSGNIFPKKVSGSSPCFQG